MALSTYVPSETQCIISGYRVDGWNKIIITRNAPTYKQVRGIRGKNTRIRQFDSSASLSFEVPMTSVVNEVFNACVLQDLAERSVRLDITITNTTNSTIFRTGTAYVLAYPEYTFENDLSIVKWQLVCDESSFQIGGNKSATLGIVAGAVSQLKDFTGGLIDQASDLF